MSQKPQLGADYRGMRFDASGVLTGSFKGAAGLRKILLDELQQMAVAFYGGDTVSVDRFLQRFCLGQSARSQTASGADKNGSRNGLKMIQLDHTLIEVWAVDHGHYAASVSIGAFVKFREGFPSETLAQEWAIRSAIEQLGGDVHGLMMRDFLTSCRSFALLFRPCDAATIESQIDGYIAEKRALIPDSQLQEFDQKVAAALLNVRPFLEAMSLGWES